MLPIDGFEQRVRESHLFRTSHHREYHDRRYSAIDLLGGRVGLGVLGLVHDLVGGLVLVLHVLVHRPFQSDRESEQSTVSYSPALYIT